jgi:hypothetical protein
MCVTEDSTTPRFLYTEPDRSILYTEPDRSILYTEPYRSILYTEPDSTEPYRSIHYTEPFRSILYTSHTWTSFTPSHTGYHFLYTLDLCVVLCQPVDQ